MNGLLRRQNSLLRRTALRFCLMALLLAAIVSGFGQRLEQLLLPLQRAQIALIDRDHQIESLALLDKPAGRVLQLTVTRRHYLFVGGKLIEPHPTATAQASTLAGGLHLTLALLLASAWCWPASERREWVWRALATLLAVPVAVALDIPMLLVAELWRLYLAAYDPAGWSPLLAWSNFMLEGGRYLLPLALGQLSCLPSLLAGSRRRAGR